MTSTLPIVFPVAAAYADDLLSVPVTRAPKRSKHAGGQFEDHVLIITPQEVLDEEVSTLDWDAPAQVIAFEIWTTTDAACQAIAKQLIDSFTASVNPLAIPGYHAMPARLAPPGNVEIPTPDIKATDPPRYGRLVRFRFTVHPA